MSYYDPEYDLMLKWMARFAAFGFVCAVVLCVVSIALVIHSFAP